MKLQPQGREHEYMMKSKRCVTSTKAVATKKEQPSIQSKIFSTIILLCDTPGYRMKSYGPPSLLQIHGEKRLIDIQIECIKKHFNNFEIILCCGFDADKICKYVKSKYKHINIRLVENQLFNESNSCETVRLALNNTNNDKIFILDGNLWFPQEIFGQHDYNTSMVLIEKKQLEGLEIGVNTNEKNQVEHFSFGAKNYWSEVFYLSNYEIIDSLRKILSNPDYKHKFVFEALNELLSTKFDLVAVTNKTKIKKIHNVKVYHNIRNIK